ncbi:MAG: LON peptidase substrate-binding domain-containing protein [Myxococcaceae bacterium]|nr:LON peptidase substrate-binding domain-containing protein [Myxococcaceae bacterium]
MTLAAGPARPLFEALAERWALWRFKRSFWTFLPRWQFQGLFLLLMACVLLLAYHGSLWGPFLVILGVSYLGRCFDETWAKGSEAHVDHLLALACEAQEAGHLNRALRLARTAEAAAKIARLNHDEVLVRQAWILLLQGRGAAALRALSRTSPHLREPPASLRVQAHLQTGESSVALTLARRMFARTPSPDTARLVAQALLQLQRVEEARHFASLAGEPPEKLAAAIPPSVQDTPAPCPWEAPHPTRLGALWTGATTVGALLSLLAVELPWYQWGSAALMDGPYGHASTFALGLLQGSLLGLAQAWVLRRFVPEPGYWPPLTALGYGLGMLGVRLLAESGAWGASFSLVEIIFFLSLKGLLATCFQTLVLGRWFRISASWLLAMLAAAPLAELTTCGLVGAVWHPSSLFAWNIPPPSEGALAGQAVLSALIRGLILGGVGGVLLQREWIRRQPRYEAPPPRPFALDCPHVLARTRPSPKVAEHLFTELPVARMQGRMFCPGADVFLSLPEADFEQQSEAFLHYYFVIIPGPAEAAGPDQAQPRVGVLAELYSYDHMRLGEDYQMTVRVLARVRLRGFESSEHGTLARIERLEDVPSERPQAQLDRLRNRLNEYIRSTPDLHLEETLSLRDPVFLADFIAANLELSLEERRALLEDLDPDSRIARVCAWLDRELLEPRHAPKASSGYVLPIRFQHAWDE